MSVYVVVKGRQKRHFLTQFGDQTLTRDILLYHQACLFLVKDSFGYQSRWTWLLSNSYILHQLFHKAAITSMCMQWEICIEAIFFFSESHRESSVFNNSLFRDSQVKYICLPRSQYLAQTANKCREIFPCFLRQICFNSLGRHRVSHCQTILSLSNNCKFKYWGLARHH